MIANTFGHLLIHRGSMILNMTLWQDSSARRTAFYPVVRVYLPSFLVFTATTFLASFQAPSVSIGDFLAFNVLSFAFICIYLF